MGTIVRLKPHGAFRREATALRRPPLTAPAGLPRSAGAFDALMTGAAVRALERQPGWAADARLGGYGPASPCRLVVATTDPAGEGHLVPGHQPAPPRRPPMPPPARTCRPTSPRSSASTDCGRGSSRATNRSRTNAAGPTQVRSDRAIRRHQTLVNCAFSFCWDQWFAPPGPLNATTPDPCPNEGPERGTRPVPRAPTALLAQGLTSHPFLAHPRHHPQPMVARLDGQGPTPRPSGPDRRGCHRTRH